ncbi:MAG TPA: SRPBCC family protein [Ornithinibacter sp.]|nr:SRPBCC family protein [Ornithinibacter sp.]
MQLSTHVDRSPEEVFAVLSDLTRDPEWRREWVAARPEAPGDAPRVGSRTTLVGRLLGRDIDTVYEVIELEPNRSVRWRGVSGPLPLVFSRSLEGIDGGTRITFVYEPAGRFGAILVLLVGWVGRRQLAGDLPALRQLLGASTGTD